MPYKSKRQLQTCFGRQITEESHGRKWTWDCEEFLKETKRPRCLPTLKGGKEKCRPLRNGENIISPVYEGPRGGLYFYAGNVKVYIPRGKLEEQYAKKKYGFVPSK